MHSGLDPTIGAILPLIGVVVGALLAGAARLALDRASERRTRDADMRSATRLLEEDLDRVLEVLAKVPEGGSEPMAVLLAAQPESWESVRSTLARWLSPGQWDALRAAVYYVNAAAPAISGINVPSDSGRRVAKITRGDLEERVADAQRAAHQAQQALHRYREHGADDDWYPAMRLPRRPQAGWFNASLE